MKKRYYDIKVMTDKIGFDVKVKYKIDFINEKNEVIYTADRLKSLTMMIKLLEEGEENV